MIHCPVVLEQNVPQVQHLADIEQPSLEVARLASSCKMSLNASYPDFPGALAAQMTVVGEDQQG